MWMPRSDGRGRRRPTNQGAAGVIALRGQLGHKHVCLVEKQGGRLGFPKGGAEVGDVDPWHTAMREWLQKTETPIEPLGSQLRPESAIVDMWGCQYFAVEWVMVGLVRTKEERKQSLFGNTQKRKHVTPGFPQDGDLLATILFTAFLCLVCVWLLFPPRPSPPPPSAELP
jgi:8-oxo-dGTP pyrophosphatase MutT (NUDIX family)